MIQKLLVAYDGSAPARRALETAADMATGMGATLTVISVVPQLFGLESLGDPFDNASVHRRELDGAESYLESRGIKAETLEARGDPAKIIEQVARKGGYDLIVIGSRGVGAARRLLMGSVSAHVAIHARAKVLIVR